VPLKICQSSAGPCSLEKILGLFGFDPRTTGKRGNVSTLNEVQAGLSIVSMSGMSRLLLFLTFAFLIAAGNFYYTAIEQVRPWFPPDFRDTSMSVALDVLIWDRSFPVEARRNYLLSMGLGAVAMLCAAVLLYLEGQFGCAVGFVCLFVYGVGYVLMRSTQYQDRL
jgi:hypothetical protein